MNKLIILSALLILSACKQGTINNSNNEITAIPSSTQLEQALSKQTPETQARYQYRHPKETLEFFGLKPGMTVIEVLPSGGWYSQILVSYLGTEGHLIGVDYAAEMWPKFNWATAEFIEKRKFWSEEWTADAKQWAGDSGAKASAYSFSTVTKELTETADAILFIRALHNLAYLDKGQFLTNALNEAKRMLKPGGIVGVVQHQAPEDKSDTWADGSRGYLKRNFVIAQLEQVGFEYLAETDINKNNKDQPGENDIVWRLPPSLSTSAENEELKEQYLRIGESNRMTLKFRKPI